MSDWKQLVRPDKLEKLLENHREQLPLKGTRNERDFVPVTRLFNVRGVGTWILSECDEDGLAFGLCIIHEPELGYVLMSELAAFNGLVGLAIEEDRHFRLTMTISEFAAAARAGKQV